MKSDIFIRFLGWIKKDTPATQNRVRGRNTHKNTYKCTESKQKGACIYIPCTSHGAYNSIKIK